MLYDQDTIFALATPPGIGGIAIVRISGSEALACLKKVFRPVKKISYTSHKLYYGALMLNNAVSDRCMVVYMRAPMTYTGEDCAELHLHGGRMAIDWAYQALMATGARLANRGEFTKRAFLNGKLDLAQAEAVMDFISAESELGAKSSLEQLDGRLSHMIRQYADALMDILCEIEAGLDFPEEDIEETALEQLLPGIEQIKADIAALTQTAQYGALIRDGALVAIAGRPNVGKSSLLNAILGRERAIVTDVPGTTRDTLEENLHYKGIIMRFGDTAGIRDGAGKVEIIGIDHAKRLIDSGDVIIVVLDGSQELAPWDEEVLALASGKPLFVAVNKSDLTQKIDIENLKEHYPNASILPVSAQKNAGVAELIDAIYAHLTQNQVREQAVITNARHAQLLNDAVTSLTDAGHAIQGGEPGDCVAIDVRNAWHALCEITGEVNDELVIDRIFEKFCVGK